MFTKCFAIAFISHLQRLLRMDQIKPPTWGSDFAEVEDTITLHSNWKFRIIWSIMSCSAPFYCQNSQATVWNLFSNTLSSVHWKLYCLPNFLHFVHRNRKKSQHSLHCLLLVSHLLFYSKCSLNWFFFFY